LQPGDRVVAHLNSYKETKIEYGDIVVFNSPKGGIWTSRVIGLPLDSIEIVDGSVFVNGQLNEIREGKEYNSQDEEVIEFEEELKNKKKIKTLRFKNNSFPDARTMAKRLIPENEYFLMGDSRDNAFDSRFIGTIKEEDILGRVIYSYWGNSSDRINIDFKMK
jgi:signal peptidase I